MIADIPRTIWILRGPPGSGKTKVAEKLLASFPLAGYVSMDKFRRDENGEYKFDPSKVKEEAQRMKDDLAGLIEQPEEQIIVDNVHSREWEYSWIFPIAEANGYETHVLEVQADFMTCALRQSHKVPFTKLQEIFERWETPIKLPDVKELIYHIYDLLRMEKVRRMHEED